MRKSKKQTEIAKVETEIIETEKVETEKVETEILETEIIETEKVDTEIIVQDDKKDLSKKENALLAVKKNGERLRDLSDKFKEDKENSNRYSEDFEQIPALSLDNNSTLSTSRGNFVLKSKNETFLMFITYIY